MGVLVARALLLGVCILDPCFLKRTKLPCLHSSEVALLHGTAGCGQTTALEFPNGYTCRDSEIPTESQSPQKRRGLFRSLLHTSWQRCMRVAQRADHPINIGGPTLKEIYKRSTQPRTLILHPILRPLFQVRNTEDLVAQGEAACGEPTQQPNRSTSGQGHHMVIR